MFKELFYYWKIDKKHNEIRNIIINENTEYKIKEIENDKNFIEWINKK